MKTAGCSWAGEKPREALGWSQVGAGPLMLGPSSTPARGSAPPASPPLAGPAGGECPERPWQASDHPSERGPVSASLRRNRAQEQTANGQGWGGAPRDAASLECSTLPRASLRCPGPSCQTLCAELWGTGQDKEPRTRSPGKTRRHLSGFWEPVEAAGPRAGPGCLRRGGKEPWLPGTDTVSPRIPPTVLSLPWFSKTPWLKEPA